MDLNAYSSCFRNRQCCKMSIIPMKINKRSPFLVFATIPPPMTFGSMFARKSSAFSSSSFDCENVDCCLVNEFSRNSSISGGVSGLLFLGRAANRCRLIERVRPRPLLGSSLDLSGAGATPTSFPSFSS